MCTIFFNSFFFLIFLSCISEAKFGTEDRLYRISDSAGELSLKEEAHPLSRRQLSSSKRYNGEYVHTKKKHTRSRTRTRTCIRTQAHAHAHA